MSASGWLRDILGIIARVDGVPITNRREYDFRGFRVVDGEHTSGVNSFHLGIDAVQDAFTENAGAEALDLAGADIANGGAAAFDSLTVGGSPVGTAATDALTAKLAVRARMPAQLTIPSTLVTDGGVTAVAGDRILLDSLTTQADRGIYIASGAGTWARAGDFNASADITDGALILVVEGTDGGTLYQLDQLDATLGTTSLTFSEVGGGGTTYTLDPAGLVGRAVTAIGAGAAAALTPAQVEALIRNRLAAATAAIAVNGQTVSDCAGVTRASGDLTLSTTVSGNVAIAAYSALAVTAGNGVSVLSADSPADVVALDSATDVNIGATTAATVTIGRAGATSASLTAPSTTITANTLLTLASTTEVETNCGIYDLNATGAVTVDTSSTCAITAGGACTITHGALLVTATRPSTDVRPPPTHIVVGQATSLASGSTTAANKVGPHMAIALGRAQTVGTDASGALFVGLGDEVAGVADIANGIRFGTGAPTGTPGDDAYRPFTTEKGSLNVRYDRLSLNIGQLIAETGSPIYLYSNDVASYVGVGNGTITCNCAGTTRLSITTTTTSLTGATTNVGTTAGNDVNIGNSTGDIGFFGATAAAKPTITGSRGGNAALASLLTAGATLGLWTDSTTA